MKRTFVIVAVMAMMLGMIGLRTPSVAAAEQKIGYVDLARVFDEYQKTKEFDKNLAGKGEIKTQERERMVNEVKKLRDEAELLSAKAKEDKQAVIDEKIKTLQEFDRSTRDELRKERDVMVKSILAEIEAVIQNFGKSQGYSLILSDRALVYKSETGDLTNLVIKDLNDSYGSKKK